MGWDRGQDDPDAVEEDTIRAGAGVRMSRLTTSAAAAQSGNSTAFVRVMPVHPQLEINRPHISLPLPNESPSGNRTNIHDIGKVPCLVQ